MFGVLQVWMLPLCFLSTMTFELHCSFLRALKQKAKVRLILNSHAWGQGLFFIFYCPLIYYIRALFGISISHRIKIFSSDQPRPTDVYTTNYRPIVFKLKRGDASWREAELCDITLHISFSCVVKKGLFHTFSNTFS